MKTRSLFGVQFVKSPRYRAEVLDNFEFWKAEKQHFYFRQKLNNCAVLNAYSIEAEKDPENSGNWDIYNPETRRLAIETAEKNLKDGTYAKEGMDFNHCNIEMQEVEKLIEEKECKHFYITTPVITESEKLATKEPYDLAWLRPIADGKRQLNFGNKFLRYQKMGPKMIALSGAFTPRQDGLCFFEYTFFNFDLVEKKQTAKLIYDDEDDYYNEISSRDFDKVSRKTLFQLIVFMELAPIEEIFLPAGHRHGKKRSEIYLTNEDSFDMTIVTKNWNRNVHIGQIDVEAHYRLQPCGPGGIYRELIYISDHYRNGYNLSAGRNKST